MKGFLFDANVPSHIRFQPSRPVVGLSLIGTNPTDTQIWDFARGKELVIVSKDADFSDRIILQILRPGWSIYDLVICAGKIFTWLWLNGGHMSSHC